MVNDVCCGRRGGGGRGVQAQSLKLFQLIMTTVFRLTRPQITAVSVETAFQNGSIAFVLLKISFPEPLGGHKAGRELKPTTVLGQVRYIVKE